MLGFFLIKYNLIIFNLKIFMVFLKKCDIIYIINKAKMKKWIAGNNPFSRKVFFLICSLIFYIIAYN